MAADFSDLEVAPQTDLPEPVKAEKIYYEDAPKEAVYKTSQDLDKDKFGEKPPRRICGLSLKGFWILLGIIALIIAAAAIGGGVGGIQASKSKNKNSNSVASESRSSSQAVASTITDPPPTLTTSLEIGPTQTLYRDCPSSNGTIYNANGSGEYQFRKLCNASFHWSGPNVVNTPARSLNECIDMCASYNVENRTAIEDRKSSFCNGVCWRNNIDDPDWPGQCFGSTFQNSSATGFPINTAETICDSAGWVNQHAP